MQRLAQTGAQPRTKARTRIMKGQSLLIIHIHVGVTQQYRRRRGTGLKRRRDRKTDRRLQGNVAIEPHTQQPSQIPPIHQHRLGDSRRHRPVITPDMRGNPGRRRARPRRFPMRILRQKRNIILQINNFHFRTQRGQKPRGLGMAHADGTPQPRPPAQKLRPHPGLVRHRHQNQSNTALLQLRGKTLDNSDLALPFFERWILCYRMSGPKNRPAPGQRPHSRTMKKPSIAAHDHLAVALPKQPGHP